MHDSCANPLFRMDTKHTHTFSHIRMYICMNIRLFSPFKVTSKRESRSALASHKPLRIYGCMAVCAIRSPHSGGAFPLLSSFRVRMHARSMPPHEYSTADRHSAESWHAATQTHTSSWFGIGRCSRAARKNPPANDCVARLKPLYRFVRGFRVCACVYV